MIFEYAILRNRWLWFHILAGGWLFMIFVNYQGPNPLFFLFMMAFAYELWMYCWRAYIKKDLDERYGNPAEQINPETHYLLDAVADVLGALLMAILIDIHAYGGSYALQL